MSLPNGSGTWLILFLAAGQSCLPASLFHGIDYHASVGIARSQDECIIQAVGRFDAQVLVPGRPDLRVSGSCLSTRIPDHHRRKTLLMYAHGSAAIADAEGGRSPHIRMHCFSGQDKWSSLYTADILARPVNVHHPVQAVYPAFMGMGNRKVGMETVFVQERRFPRVLCRQRKLQFLPDSNLSAAYGFGCESTPFLIWHHSTAEG